MKKLFFNGCSPLASKDAKVVQVKRCKLKKLKLKGFKSESCVVSEGTGAVMNVLKNILAHIGGYL